MVGKQYLLDLTEAGYPVIPTVDTKADIGKLPDVPKYVIKPKDGADSIGLEFLTREGLMARNLVPAFSQNAKNTSRKVKRSQSGYVYFCVQSIDPS